jgi:hypothetical protein
MADQGSLRINVDVQELIDLSKKLTQAAKVTSTAISIGLNEVGDQVLAALAVDLTRDTGLALEQIRGLIKVRRSTKNRLEYEMTINEHLLERELTKLEGKRESKDFGDRKPGQLVIVVSKKDELVCMDCEELAAAGPMPIEIAKQHVPKHPHCRCVILPYISKKRMPVTMTSVSGTSSRKRAGEKNINEDKTMRQLAQEIINRTSRDIKISIM